MAWCIQRSIEPFEIVRYRQPSLKKCPSAEIAFKLVNSLLCLSLGFVFLPQNLKLVQI